MLKKTNHNNSPKAIHTEISHMASHNLSAFSKLEGLNDSNWEHWKMRTRALFTLAGLIKWIDGTAPHPSSVDKDKPTKEEIEKIEKYLEKEQETQALLQLAIGLPSELAHTYGAQNAAEMWRQLSDVKEPKGIHSIVNAYRAMFCTYASEGESIMEHISKLCTHRNTLNTLGAPILDEMFTILVLVLLPDSWDSFTRSYFGNKGKAIVTLQELIRLVIDEAKRLAMKEKETNIANQTQAFNNNRQTPTTYTLSINHTIPRCPNCDRTGHTKERCWSRGSGMEGQGPRQPWRGRRRNETANQVHVRECLCSD